MYNNIILILVTVEEKNDRFYNRHSVGPALPWAHLGAPQSEWNIGDCGCAREAHGPSFFPVDIW